MFEVFLFFGLVYWIDFFSHKVGKKVKTVVVISSVARKLLSRLSADSRDFSLWCQ